MNTDPAPAPKVRKDVARNRALLLRTADQLLSDDGLEISFHELAAAAGVGVGTVYRHFADRDALVGELIERRFVAARQLLLEAEGIEDPVEALRSAIVAVCGLHVSDRAAWQAILSNAELHRELAQEHLQDVSTRIAVRAVETGRIRPDFQPTDVPLIMLMMAALTQATAQVRSDLWRRYLDTLLDGFLIRGGGGPSELVEAPTESDIDRIVVGIHA